MQELKNNFNNKCNEVEKYLKFIDFIENLYKKDTFNSKFDEQIIKVLKANTFLLLYNLVESTVDGTIDYLLVKICDNNIKFDSIIDELQLQWSKVHVRQNLKSLNDDIIENNLKDILNKTLSDYIKFEGEYKPKVRDNIDADELRTIAKSFGFKWKPSKKLKGGVILDTIKKHRNDLAHGAISFSECGRDYIITQLKEIYDKTVKILNEFMDTVEDYTRNELYKRQSST